MNIKTFFYLSQILTMQILEGKRNKQKVFLNNNLPDGSLKAILFKWAPTIYIGYSGTLETMKA